MSSNLATNNNTSSYINNYIQSLTLQHNMANTSNSAHHQMQQSQQQPNQALPFLSLLSKSLSSVASPTLAASLLNSNSSNSYQSTQHTPHQANSYSSNLLQGFQNPLNYQQLAYYLAAQTTGIANANGSSSSVADTTSSSILTNNSNASIIKSPTKWLTFFWSIFKTNTSVFYLLILLFVFS